MNRAIRPPLAICASFALVATSLVWLSSGAQATPSLPQRRVSAPAHAAAPASSRPEQLADRGQQRCQPGRARLAGGQQRHSHAIRREDLHARGSTRVPGCGSPTTTPERRAPRSRRCCRTASAPMTGPCSRSTRAATAGTACSSPTTCASATGTWTGSAQDTVARFDVPWWWRTDFTPNPRAGQHATLIVNGVIGSANVWVNGHEVATISHGHRQLHQVHLQYHRPGPARHELAWRSRSTRTTRTRCSPSTTSTGTRSRRTTTPASSSRSSSRWTGALSDSNAHVLQHNTANLSRSTLTVQADITNNTGTPQTGQVNAAIDLPGHHQGLGAVAPVTVPANSTKTVMFSGLTINHPQVWWPYQLGAQPLYTLTTSVSQHGKTLNSTSETFGIRNVTSYLAGSSPAEPPGARAFKINGVPIVIRGGGFSPNLFLHYSTADTARQIALMKNMGVNTIRLEGHIMPSEFFQQMDQAGILVNAGYQCCDGWQLQQSTWSAPPTSRSWALRADHRAEPAQPPERVQLPVERRAADPPSRRPSRWPPSTRRTSQDPVISSAENNRSPKLGVVRGEGRPLRLGAAQLLVRHARSDTHDSTQTNAGGAWGYDSEESAGDTIPTLDSLHRFMSATELSNLWRNPTLQPVPPELRATVRARLHLRHAVPVRRTRSAPGTAPGPACPSTSKRHRPRTTRTPGRSSRRSSTTRNNKPLPSTGTIYWQMNKGWPSLLWNLYGSDGDQAGSYFGTQEANRPLHALYALDNGTVTVDNLGGRRQAGLSVEAKVYSLAWQGALRPHRRRASTLASQQVRTEVLTPKVPAGRPDPGLLRRTAAHASTGRWPTATCTGCPPNRTR